MKFTDDTNSPERHEVIRQMIEKLESRKETEENVNCMNQKIIYHQTPKENVSKILEFGFDLHLSGQSSLKRLKTNSPRIRNDKFVEFIETLPENQVINTTIDPFFLVTDPGDAILRITLKPTVRLLDASTVGKLKNAKWEKMITYTRERQYDGLIDENYVFLFSNKSIAHIIEINSE